MCDEGVWKHLSIGSMVALCVCVCLIVKDDRKRMRRGGDGEQMRGREERREERRERRVWPCPGLGWLFNLPD